MECVFGVLNTLGVEIVKKLVKTALIALLTGILVFSAGCTKVPPRDLSELLAMPMDKDYTIVSIGGSYVNGKVTDIADIVIAHRDEAEFKNGGKLEYNSMIYVGDKAYIVCNTYDSLPGVYIRKYYAIATATAPSFEDFEFLHFTKQLSTGNKWNGNGTVSTNIGEPGCRAYRFDKYVMFWIYDLDDHYFLFVDQDSDETKKIEYNSSHNGGWFPVEDHIIWRSDFYGKNEDTRDCMIIDKDLNAYEFTAVGKTNEMFGDVLRGDDYYCFYEYAKDESQERVIHKAYNYKTGEYADENKLEEIAALPRHTSVRMTDIDFETEPKNESARFTYDDKAYTVERVRDTSSNKRYIGLKITGDDCEECYEVTFEDMCNFSPDFKKIFEMFSDVPLTLNNVYSFGNEVFFTIEYTAESQWISRDSSKDVPEILFRYDHKDQTVKYIACTRLGDIVRIEYTPCDENEEAVSG